MKENKKLSPKVIAIIAGAALIVILAVLALILGDGITEVPSDDVYSYVNPDESKAQTDEGITIDGVLDEKVYQDNNWLYLHNDDGGNNVDIAMTSYFGEKGMYFVYDVTESVPIYVNLNRNSYMNSCIEMYFAPSSVTSLKENSYFEVDMLPTGDMVFKKSNGKGGYVNAATTDDIMAHLGATTKGGAVNTESCYGYCLELFIPWEYMQWLGLDAQQMQQGFVYVDPAHITSHNLNGTDTSVDRYWYYYAQQQGAGFSDVYQYFRFNGDGIMGTVPVELTADDHCTLTGDSAVIPGMQTTYTVTCDSGYTLSSITVNGEEYINKVAFGRDGSVSLTVRGQKEGLKIAAQTQAVTDGSKTLSGTVALSKNGGDSLSGVLMIYSGPQGEKPVEVDSQGHFTLTELPQGYYTLTVEKEGYTTVSRGIYLDCDRTADLVLEFDTFYSELGTSWVLDEQNSGIIQKFGGRGYLLSTDQFGSFTYEAKFFYDEDLAQEADTDFFQQQRSGMRIAFSNGKFWHIDLLKENGEYIVQYAKHSGDNSVFGWKGICTMNAAQKEKYCSDEGISLKFIRSGQYAAIWLDGTLLSVEKLDAEYAGCTAQAGLEYWVANRDILRIPYSLSQGAAVNVASAPFQKGAQWDVSGMFNGFLVKPASTGDSGWLNTYDSLYRQITVNVSDKTPDSNNFKTAVHFEFAGGETFRIGLTNADTGELGTYKIQILEANSIVKNWGTRYRLTQEQIEKLQSGAGIDFRVAIVGDQANVYLDNVQVCTIDLSKDTEGNDTGIADQTAKIGIRMYGNEGQSVKVAFDLGSSPNSSTITQTENSQAVIQGSSHLIGETVVILPADGGCELVSLKLDGQEMTLTDPDSFQFTATKETHTIEAVSKRVRDFAPSSEWNTDDQTSGILTVPGSDGDSGWIQTYSSSYSDIDLKLKLQDLHTDDGNYRAAIRLSFGNGEYVTFSLTNAKVTDDDPAIYELQNMGGSILDWYQVKDYRLSDQQVSQLRGEGIELRLVRKGDIADIYIGGEHAFEYDLSKKKDGTDSLVADENTNVQLRFYGNTGKDVTVSYALLTQVQTVEVTLAQSQLAANQKNYILGDTVIISDAGQGETYCSGITANGTAVSADENGSFPFTATEESYSVSGTFSQRVFKNSAEWNTLAQDLGRLVIPGSDGDSGWIETYKADYQDLDLALQLQDLHHEAGNYRAAVALDFGNDVNAIFTITNAASQNDETTVYTLQSMPSSFHNWGSYYTLTDQQSEAIRSGEGIGLRIVRVGTEVLVYLGGEYACRFDLTTCKDGSASQIADQTAKIRLRFYGNNSEDISVPFVLTNDAKMVTISMSDFVGGTVTADRISCLPGDTVTLTLRGNSGYYHQGLQINGQTVDVNPDGTYSFTATEDSYTVSTSFAAGVFTDFGGNAWNLTNQNVGKLHISASSNGAGWMQTAGNYNELELTVKDYAGGSTHEYAVVGQLYFENGKYVSIRLIYDKNNDRYTLQSMGDSVANWATHHTLTAQQYAKVRDEGIRFRMTRMGTVLKLYLDDEFIKNVDLTGRSSGITATMTCVAKVRYYNNKGYDVTLPFKLDNPGQTGTVTIEPCENGTVTADKLSYTIGESVTLTVVGNDGYYHNGLTVNGKTVVPNASGTYSFIATEESYTVSTSFSKGIFKNFANNLWNLINQNAGVLHISSANNGAGWMEANGIRNSLELTVKDYAGGNTHEYAVVGQLYFENGKYISIRLIYDKNNDRYTLQSMGDSVANWAIHHTLTAQQYAKVRGDGIRFKMVREGTSCHLYLDDVLVKTVDLTGRSSGITATMTCVAKVRYYNNKGYDVTLPFVLGEEQNN